MTTSVLVRRAVLLAILGVSVSPAQADEEVVRTTYSNGSPRSEATKKDGVLHGTQTLWTVGGGRTTKTFVGGVEHGPVARYYDNGNKMEEGQYEWGLKTGAWASYDINGEIVFAKSYELGKLHGAHTQYGEGRGARKGTRTPVRVVTYVFGVEHGDAVEYWHDGELQAQGPYVYGKKHGTWTYYDDKGTHSRQVRFACGKKVVGDAIEGTAPDSSSCNTVKVSISRPKRPKLRLDNAIDGPRPPALFDLQVCSLREATPGVQLVVDGKAPRCPTKSFRTKGSVGSGVRG